MVDLAFFAVIYRARFVLCFTRCVGLTSCREAITIAFATGLDREAALFGPSLQRPVADFRPLLPEDAFPTYRGIAGRPEQPFRSLPKREHKVAGLLGPAKPSGS
jgi:hypothetical protein